MQNIFFTADSHVGHCNLCRGVSHWKDKSGCRYFNTVEEMNELILKNINDVVRVNDVLYHLGDFAWGDKAIFEFRSQIKCKNIHLIVGNHDGDILTRDKFKPLFKSITKINDIKINGQHIVLCHTPFASWNKKCHNSWHLYGHIHANPYPFDNRYDLSMNVGVDTNEFKPYSHEEVEIYMKKILDSRPASYFIKD